MKKTLLIILLFSFTSIVFQSCKEKSEDKTGDNMEVADTSFDDTPFFEANPQAIPKQEVTTLDIGAKAPDFNLPGVDGKFHKLSDYDEFNTLVIIFTCNHCPTAQAYEDRIIQIQKDYKDEGVQVIAISPNSIRGLLYLECGYSDMGDSFEDMIVRAKDKDFNFPYLYDGDDHEVSLQYGPVATPHAFVFNKERTLSYIGRLDKSEKPGTANAEDLRTAIEAVVKGESVAEPKTKTFGCSVKWAWKDEYFKKENKEWTAKEVTLDEIDEAGIKKLLANDTEGLRLINIWATWCGPCVTEYPEFVKMQRMYSPKGFEFVSISADRIESKDRVLKFLKKSTSALPNYIFNGTDKYALIEAIDPDWDGALPYTVLVEPGGKVLHKIMGSIEPYALKKIIVEHETLGRYF